MSLAQYPELTHLLIDWAKGDETALEQLAPLVDSELRRLARLYLSREERGGILQPTALVNEAYLRLIQWKAVDWRNRAHFFAVAAKMMRRILVSQAIARSTKKRGGSAVMISLTAAVESKQAGGPAADLIALDLALAKLAAFDERKCQLVELRFFGGLSEEEAAEVMKISVRSVQREWSLARAWLLRELSV